MKGIGVLVMAMLVASHVGAEQDDQLGLPIGAGGAAMFGVCYGACFGTCMVAPENILTKVLKCGAKCLSKCLLGFTPPSHQNDVSAVLHHYSKLGCSFKQCLKPHIVTDPKNMEICVSKC